MAYVGDNVCMIFFGSLNNERDPTLLNLKDTFIVIIFDLLAYAMWFSN